MSGTPIKEFLVSLGFDVDDKSLADFSAGVTSASAKVFALGAAVTAAAGLVFAGVNKIADKLDTLSDTAALLDTTAEAVARFGYAATLNDSSVEAATASLFALNETAGQAALGYGRGLKYFEALGIRVKDTSGKIKSATVLMGEVGDKLKDLDRGEQVGVLKGLGIDRTMLATMTGGLDKVAHEIDAMYAAAGLNINEAAANASDFKDELSRLNGTFGAMTTGIAAKFLVPFTDGMATLRKMLLETMPRIIAAVVPVIDVILKVAAVFLALASRAAQAVSVVIDWVLQIQAATDGWAGVILAVVAAWKYLNLAFLASPVGMIMALGLALGLLIDDFMTWKEGGDSLIDWAAWAPGIDAAVAGITVLRDILAGWFDMSFRGIDMLVKLLSGDFAGAWKLVGDQINAFINIGKRAGEILRSIGASMGFGGGSLQVSGMTVPALTPSPQAAAAVKGSGGQTISQNTTITVAGGASPEATGRAVAGQQRGVNSDMARNMKGAAK